MPGWGCSHETTGRISPLLPNATVNIKTLAGFLRQSKRYSNLESLRAKTEVLRCRFSAPRGTDLGVSSCSQLPEDTHRTIRGNIVGDIFRRSLIYCTHSCAAAAKKEPPAGSMHSERIPPHGGGGFNAFGMRFRPRLRLCAGF